MPLIRLKIRDVENEKFRNLRVQSEYQSVNRAIPAAKIVIASGRSFFISV